jgi:hypothetical protein
LKGVIVTIEVNANRGLIEEAKAKLVAKPKASKKAVKSVEALDAVLANELLARRQELYDAEKRLKAERDEIEAILKDMIGSADELTVHGARVASIARWRETSLITETVKAQFPVVEFPELYKKSDKSRLTVH